MQESGVDPSKWINKIYCIKLDLGRRGSSRRSSASDGMNAGSCWQANGCQVMQETVTRSLAATKEGSLALGVNRRSGTKGSFCLCLKGKSGKRGSKIRAGQLFTPPQFRALGRDWQAEVGKQG